MPEGKITDFFLKESPKSARQVQHGRPDMSGSKPAVLGATSRPPRVDSRSRLRVIAAETLDAIEKGSYSSQNKAYDLKRPVADSCAKTSFFSPDSFLKNWATNLPPQRLGNALDPSCVKISVLEITTVQGARLLCEQKAHGQYRKVGLLNFASAKKEGGGFINGAQAQEESIARVSTIYPSLKTTEGQRFYKLHRSDNGHGYYSHAMIYSPDIHFIRDDDIRDASWREPITVDIVTSPAVNVGVVLRYKSDEERIEGKKRIERAMRERMGRILYLFEHKGVDAVVLGSFGTGVFKNDVPMVANVWKDFLAEGGRFARSFQNVTFAVIGHDTYQQFKETLGPLEDED